MEGSKKRFPLRPPGRGEDRRRWGWGVGWSKPMKTNTLPQLDNPPPWGVSFTYYKKKKGYPHVPEENSQTNNMRGSYERNPLMAHGEESILC